MTVNSSVHTSEVTTDFGRKLQELRARSGLSLRALEEQSGMQAQWINGCERGHRPAPPAERVRAVAQALCASDEETSELIALAAAERGLVERPPGLGDDAWSELVLRWVREAEALRGPSA